MERDFSQWLQVRGQGWSNTGTGCPEGLQCLGAGQNTSGRSLLLLINPVLRRERWASDLQSSLPNSTIVWFCNNENKRLLYFPVVSGKQNINSTLHAYDICVFFFSNRMKIHPHSNVNSNESNMSHATFLFISFQYETFWLEIVQPVLKAWLRSLIFKLVFLTYHWCH